MAEVGSATTTVSPGQLAAVTTFTVTNNSNATLDFALTVAQQAGSTAAHGGTDTFDTTNVKIYVDANGNGLVVTVQTAYGFNITVHPAYASKFQKFFALLKERGYKVPAHMTKCWAPHGTHVAGSNHYIGAACDIQTGWNRGPEFVYHMNDIVEQAGLYNGCTFRDCGHVEAVRGTHNRAPNLYAAMEKFKSEQSTANYQP